MPKNAQTTIQLHSSHMLAINAYYINNTAPIGTERKKNLTLPLGRRSRRAAWFKIGKGVHQGYILLPFLFNFHAKYIMQNAGLDESQATNEVARKNVSNVRYADDTTLMAESEEELKSLLMKVKEENEKTGIKLNIQKTKIMPSCPLTSWRIDGDKMETVTGFIFLGSTVTADGD